MSRLEPNDTCNICSCEFDIASEGGVQGYIGILPFSLCPMCFSGLMDMFDQLSGDLEEYDNESGQEMEDDDEDSHG